MHLRILVQSPDIYLSSNKSRNGRKTRTVLHPDRNITNLVPGHKLVQLLKQSLNRLVDKGLEFGQSTHRVCT